MAQLVATCETGGFAIFGARLGLDQANDLVPSAITAAGADAGQLRLASSQRPPHLLALAPDGAWVAWVPEGSLPDSYGKGGQPVVCFTDDPKSHRTVRYRGWFGLHLALSSSARHLVLIVRDKDGTRSYHRLLLLRPETGETVDDLTGIVTGFDFGKVERLRLSSGGTRLALGTRDSFLVIDLPHRTVLLEANGRYPCLSPSGEEVAFVDPSRNLALANLATGMRRTLDGGTAYSVGSFTPDGGLLIAFVRRPLALDAKLVAIDYRSRRYANITTLEEWNLGQNCGLVRRTLLSPTSASASG